MVATELAPTQMKKKRVFGEINDKREIRPWLVVDTRLRDPTVVGG
jgi:hypothetical protein